MASLCPLSVRKEIFLDCSWLREKRMSHISSFSSERIPSVTVWTVMPASSKNLSMISEIG